MIEKKGNILNKGKLSPQLIVGLTLTILFWILNWSLPGLRTHLLFFPLWLGYCLTVDGLLYFRSGSSFISRNPVKFAFMFLISIPGWWLFELINHRTNNWFYQGKNYFSNIEFFIYASINFSTVMPSVFTTSELISTSSWIRGLKRGASISKNKKVAVLFLLIGTASLSAVLLMPDYFYPLLWLSIYLIIEPINILTENPTLLDYLSKGDWRPLISLWIGVLICGFFWEMWNYLSYPKWVYRTPHVDFCHVFEMPLLGYLGYIPFSMELFALYHLISGLPKNKFKIDFFMNLNERS